MQTVGLIFPQAEFGFLFSWLVAVLSEEGVLTSSEHNKGTIGLVQEQIIRYNEQYKGHEDKRRKQVLYREGDLVWIHLRKERFLAERFGKLKPRGDGPFCVLKKSRLAYKDKLLVHYNVSALLMLWIYAVNERVNVTNTLGAYLLATNFMWRIGQKFAWSLKNGPTVKPHCVAMSLVSFGPFEIGILQAGGELWKIWSKISKDEDLLNKIKITEDIS
ncbi:hypothetical protein Tco_0505682 [Tanacetum coccineum]